MPLPALIPLGRHAGHPSISLDRPITLVGSRKNAHLHLVSQSVDPAHALLLLDQSGHLFIRDLASHAGILVNESPITESQLHPDDLLQIGSFLFRISDASADAAPPPSLCATLQSPDQTLPLTTRTFLIGRRPQCDLVLNDNRISRIHAAIIELDGHHILRDLGSRAGTLVNNSPAQEHTLSPNDQIQLPTQSFSYHPAPVDQPAEESPLLSEDDLLPLDLDPDPAPPLLTTHPDPDAPPPLAESDDPDALIPLDPEPSSIVESSPSEPENPLVESPAPPIEPEIPLPLSSPDPTPDHPIDPFDELLEELPESPLPFDPPPTITPEPPIAPDVTVPVETPIDAFDLLLDELVDQPIDSQPEIPTEPPPAGNFQFAPDQEMYVTGATFTYHEEALPAELPQFAEENPEIPPPILPPRPTLTGPAAGRSVDVFSQFPVLTEDPPLVPLSPTPSTPPDPPLLPPTLRKLKIGLLSILLVTAISSIVAYFLTPTTSIVKATLTFHNFDHLTPDQQQSLITRQRNLLADPEIRRAAIEQVTGPGTPGPGFLASTDLSFSRTVEDPLLFPPSTPGTLTLTLDSSHPSADASRLAALTHALANSPSNRALTDAAHAEDQKLHDLQTTLASLETRSRNLIRQSSNQALPASTALPPSPDAEAAWRAASLETLKAQSALDDLARHPTTSEALRAARARLTTAVLKEEVAKHAATAPEPPRVSPDQTDLSRNLKTLTATRLATERERARLLADLAKIPYPEFSSDSLTITPNGDPRFLYSFATAVGAATAMTALSRLRFL